MHRLVTTHAPLVATGVNAYGHRESLDLQATSAEGLRSPLALFRDLKHAADSASTFHPSPRHQDNNIAQADLQAITASPPTSRIKSVHHLPDLTPETRLERQMSGRMFELVSHLTMVA